jgi:dihydrofolate synthase/folylpolyglutamate synthase
MGLAARPEAGAGAAEETLARLIKLHPKLIDLSLGRLRRLLDLLGNPERNLPPIVHVAGTNGKGSTIAYMRAALEASGRRVHVMTSPHLVRYNERIRLAGALISDAHLIAVLTACEDANRGEPITYFEITTAAAFLAFRDTPGDILLLETGLGGRLDASNVIENPLLTAITTVSMDHQNFLGDTLTGIAHEKAGILKPGVTGIIARQMPEADRVIAADARAVGAALLRQGHDWNARISHGRLEFSSTKGDHLLPLPGLHGSHQIQNASLALACLQNLGDLSPRPEHLAAGLTNAQWPGRLQRLTRGPLCENFGGEIWLDGGHNPGAGAALAKTLQGWRDRDRDGDDEQRPLHLIVGMLDNKDVDNFLAPFRPLAPTVHAVPVPHEDAAMDPGRIVRAAQGLGLPVTRTDSVATALGRISDSGAPPRVLICGTLYLAGSILASNPQDGAA